MLFRDATPKGTAGVGAGRQLQRNAYLSITASARRCAIVRSLLRPGVPQYVVGRT
jgi:hypothetical protein